MKVVLIDYGSGNLRSAAKAFEHVANGTVQVSADARALEDATHIVLPGVGAFGDCIAGLTAVPSMLEALARNVRERKKPFLGICVGMQMLLDEGHEHGVHKGLGWISGKVLPLTPRSSALKVPHMGWNDLTPKENHPLLNDIPTGAHAYFVHSYHAVCDNAKDVIAEVDYGGKVAAVIARGNIMGTQFHPEKSQALGLQLLKNFIALG